VKKKKAYSMIELIMAVGSLLLVLGVFSVIVKTYLEEFSEGTLGERKWADVQTFFTYMNRDLEALVNSLGTGETLEINSNGTINIKSSDSTTTDSVVYSADSTGNGTISRDGTVILRGNDNFKISGLELKVYENFLDGNSINSNWGYEVSTGDTVEISSEATSNYYVEPVISLAEGSEITGGYALRFDNVTESEETVIYKEIQTEKWLNENTIYIDSSSYSGLTKTVTLTADYGNGNNPITSVTYTDKEGTEHKNITTDKTVSPGEYQWSNVSIGNEMKFEFDMQSKGEQDVTIKVTISD
jgi:hypothetical protein